VSESIPQRRREINRKIWLGRGAEGGDNRLSQKRQRLATVRTNREEELRLEL
jgi:hypothetical protein